MACRRSGFRPRLAPPAFACFASYGSASHTAPYRSEASEGCRVVARLGEDGPRQARLPVATLTATFASYGSASHTPPYRSEASESCRAVAPLREDGPRQARFPAATLKAT